MKIYMDVCCYNRPYDDQSQIRISLETEAKLYIQELVVCDKVKLVQSFVLKFENSNNPFEARRNAINRFIKTRSSEFVSKNSEIYEIANRVNQTGVKPKDSLHIACAIFSKCDYFISTDDRVLKYKDERIKIVDPIEFIKEWEAANDD